MKNTTNYKNHLAYIIGVAIGDGNLSNPNGRATRLRITCDLKYKKLIKNIAASLGKVFPVNKISSIKRRDSCVDISCYSNRLEGLFGWKAKNGSKIEQNVSIPKWIKKNRISMIKCLKGLFETDGSVYSDRGYIMANFTTAIYPLSQDVMEMITRIGFRPNLQTHQAKDGRIKYTIRITQRAKEFIKIIKMDKS